MRTVMVIDDSAFMRKNIRQILDEDGNFRIVAEDSNGKNIVPLYKKYKPDIVTLDLDMPEVDGVAALESLLKDYPDAVVVILTAQGRTESVIQSIKLGARSHLVKPFEKRKLINILTAVLKNNFSGDD